MMDKTKTAISISATFTWALIPAELLQIVDPQGWDTYLDLDTFLHDVNGGSVLSGCLPTGLNFWLPDWATKVTLKGEPAEVEIRAKVVNLRLARRSIRRKRRRPLQGL